MIVQSVILTSAVCTIRSMTVRQIVIILAPITDHGCLIGSYWESCAHQSCYPNITEQMRLMTMTRQNLLMMFLHEQSLDLWLLVATMITVIMTFAIQSPVNKSMTRYHAWKCHANIVYFPLRRRDHPGHHEERHSSFWLSFIHPLRSQ